MAHKMTRLRFRPEKLINARVLYIGTLPNKSVVYPGTVQRDRKRLVATASGLTQYDFSHYDVKGKPIPAPFWLNGRRFAVVRHPGHIGRFMAERAEGQAVFQVLMPFKQKIRLAAKMSPPAASYAVSYTRKRHIRLRIEYIFPRSQVGFEQACWVVLGQGQNPAKIMNYFR